MNIFNNPKIELSGREHDLPRIESFTRENIGGYMKYIPLDNRKVLTTDGSGDQVLNAVFYGAKDLSLCHENVIAYHYLYLKIAALLILNYKEFQWFFLRKDMNMHNNNKVFSKRLYKKVRPVLKLINPASYEFFENEFELNNNQAVRNSLLVDSGYHNKAIKNFNIYLRNEDAYSKLRDSIIRINLNYIEKDVYKESIDGKFDVILLSNLAAKLTLHKFISLINELDSYNLNDDGIMMLCYLWNNNVYTEEYANVWKKIYDDPNSNKLIRKYIIGFYNLSGYKNYLWEDNKREDKALIYRKK